MEQINKTAKGQLNPDSIINQIKQLTTTVKPNLKSLLENPNGFNALDLIGENIDSNDLLKAEEILKLNYGVDYSKERFTILWKEILNANWTKERLIRTVKWFLKTKKYPNWTNSDWFDYEIKIYPYSWYLKQINEGIKSSDMIAYRIDGKIFWKIKDGIELPFEKII